MVQHIPPQSLIEQWDIGGLELSLQNEFASVQALGRWLEEDDGLDEEGLAARVLGQIEEEYGAKEGRWRDAGIDMRLVEKQIMLQILDQRWKEHLASMDQLRQGIHLRAYAQKQPKQEFKRESFELFQDLLQNIKFDVVRMLSRMQIENPEEIEAQERLRRAEAAQKMNFQHSQTNATTDAGCCAAQGSLKSGKPLCGKSVKWAAMSPVLVGQEKVQAVLRPALTVMRCHMTDSRRGASGGESG